MDRRGLPVGRFVLFVVLSLLDLILTWILLTTAEGRIYERNPIARAWLVKYGWAGMVIFKALGVMLIAVAALTIARYRPRTAARIMGFACIALAAVLLYSSYLAVMVFWR